MLWQYSLYGIVHVHLCKVPHMYDISFSRSLYTTNSSKTTFDASLIYSPLQIIPDNLAVTCQNARPPIWRQRVKSAVLTLGHMAEHEPCCRSIPCRLAGRAACPKKFTCTMLLIRPGFIVVSYIYRRIPTLWPFCQKELAVMCWLGEVKLDLYHYMMTLLVIGYLQYTNTRPLYGVVQTTCYTCMAVFKRKSYSPPTRHD